MNGDRFDATLFAEGTRRVSTLLLLLRLALSQENKVVLIDREITLVMPRTKYIEVVSLTLLQHKNP
jgi:hypothetical protein